MKNHIKIFKALSDQNRIIILKMLEVRQLCVCEITCILGLSQSTVSKHCSILRDAGFILDIKQGKWVDYKINPEPEFELTKQMLTLLPTWLSDDKIIKVYTDKVIESDRNTICCNQTHK